MKRRSFLGALAGALTLDPERLLWRPGAKLISIPKARPVAPRITLRVISEYSIWHHQMISRIDAWVDGLDGPALAGSVVFEPAQFDEAKSILISHTRSLFGGDQSTLVRKA